MDNNNARFSFEEFVSASIGGVGLLLVILGFMLAGFGTVSDSFGNLLVVVGLILLFLATVIWVVWTQPWKKFDDLKTGRYTGHDHDHDHDDHDHDEEVASDSEGEILATAHPSVPVEAEMNSAGSSEQSVDAGDPIAVEEVEAVGEVASEPEPESVAEVKEVTEPVAKVEAKPDPKPAAKEKAKLAKEAKPKKAAKKKEEAPATKASGEAQDLTVIEGIGPKTAEALTSEGVTTYAQLAALSEAEIEEMVKVKHKVRVLSGAAKTWPKQAKLLADGDVDGLAAYQATLKGGREVD